MEKEKIKEIKEAFIKKALQSDFRDKIQNIDYSLIWNFFEPFLANDESNGWLIEHGGFVTATNDKGSIDDVRGQYYTDKKHYWTYERNKLLNQNEDLQKELASYRSLLDDAVKEVQSLESQNRDLIEALEEVWQDFYAIREGTDEQQTLNYCIKSQNKITEALKKVKKENT